MLLRILKCDCLNLEIMHLVQEITGLCDFRVQRFFIQRLIRAIDLNSNFLVFTDCIIRERFRPCYLSKRNFKI